MILARLDDELVEAALAVKDKNLDYRCPECNGMLVLNKGDIYVHHFKHKQETNCDGNPMTFTHKYAEKCLEEAIGKKIWLPKINKPIMSSAINGDSKILNAISTIQREAHLLGYWGTIPHILSEVEAFSEKQCEIKSVIVEPNYGEFRPDIEIETAVGNRLFLEIMVTHKVDEEKIKKLTKYGVPTLEIDLSFLEELVKNNQVDNLKKSIEDIIFTDKILEHCEWLVKPNINNDFFLNNISQYIAPNVKDYTQYRSKFKFHIFIPECSNYNYDNSHSMYVSLFEKVDKLLGFSFPYEITFNSYLKNKHMCIRQHKDDDTPLNKYNSFYKTYLADNDYAGLYYTYNGFMRSFVASLNDCKCTAENEQFAYILFKKHTETSVVSEN